MRAIPKTDKSLDQPLGRYQLIALLGQGGMADVYLACTQGPGGFQKLLVVKLARFTGDPMLSRMFLDEARLAAQLSHPNVVQTFEVGEEGSRHFMVMEYLDGATLSRLRQRAVSSGGVPLRLAVQMLTQVLEGLEYAHQARGIDGKLLKVVHRDLTPSNIVITAQGVTKILDFGIAKAADSYSFTQAGRYSGKLAYMPPEQLRAERVDDRADIFSVGVILAESALGMRFWGNATEPMVASRLISGDLPSLENVPGLDPELREICEKALAPDRDHRYANAGAFKADLNRFLQKLGGPAPREEIAEFVCAMVREDRAKLQAIVDGQLQQAAQLPRGNDLMPDLPRIEATPLRSAIHSVATAPRSAVHSVAVSPRESFPRDTGLREAAPHDAAPQAQLESVDSVDVQLVPSDAPTDHSVAPPTDRAVPSLPRRLSTRALAGIGGGVAVAAVLAFVMLRSGSPTPQVGTATALPISSGSSAVTDLTPTVPAAGAPVRLEIVVSPPEATIVLDGKSLGANPYVGAHPRDALSHELTVSAAGYQDLNQRFTLDRDMMLQLHLQPVKEPVVSEREATVATTPPSRAGSSSTSSSSSGRRGRESSRDRGNAREPAPAPAAPPPQDVVAAPPAPAPTAKPSGRDGKRALDSDVFDGKSGKRALDSDVFDATKNETKKPSIDRDTPWKK